MIRDMFSRWGAAHCYCVMECVSVRDSVAFKGNQGRLELHVAPGVDYQSGRESILDKLAAKRSFFAGSACVNVVGDGWNEEQRKELSNTLREEFGMLCVEFGEMAPNMPMEDSIRRERGQSRPAAKVSAEPPLDLRSSVGACRECNAMFVQETVRNGQRIAYDGDIVVCGDVNFGGELVATGSIAVMGALRGVAHAGSAGDETAIVTAYRLQPQQLRIGAQIAIAPDGEQEEVGYPEIASVFQGTITIRPASRVIRKQQ